MDEQKLETAEKDLALIEKRWSSTGYAALLAGEIRRLRTLLEQTENLLARAVIDSDAFRLGQQAERGRVQRLFRDAMKDDWKEDWPGAWWKLEELFQDIADVQPETVDPLPPEQMRERIRELEEALAPLANLVHRMDAAQQAHPNYHSDANTVWVLSLQNTAHFVVGDSDHFTAEQVRRAAQALAKEE